MCKFLNLFLGDEGYIVYCEECCCYQVGYAGMILSLKETDFKILHDLVKQRLIEETHFLNEDVKQIVLPTPYTGLSIFLTVKELHQFNSILESAATEMTILAMLTLFTLPQGDSSP